MKKCVVVLGMHRSGTSMLTGILKILGVELGSPLLTSGDKNKLCLFEHIDILEIDNKILSILGSSWDDISNLPFNWQNNPKIAKHKDKIKRFFLRYSNYEIFGIKEPRISILLPLYLQVFKELRRQGIETYFIIIERNNFEIAQSLKERNGFTKEKSLALCKKYKNSIKRYTKNARKIIVNYDDLIDKTEIKIQKILDFLDHSELKRYNSVKEELFRFINPRLKHHNSPKDNIKSKCLGVIKYNSRKIRYFILRNIPGLTHYIHFKIGKGEG